MKRIEGRHRAFQMVVSHKLITFANFETGVLCIPILSGARACYYDFSLLLVDEWAIYLEVDA